MANTALERSTDRIAVVAPMVGSHGSPAEERIQVGHLRSERSWDLNTVGPERERFGRDYLAERTVPFRRLTARPDAVSRGLWRSPWTHRHGSHRD